ncbi:hypothetical protein [Peterkaempfera sp. SMS 1(5)a]|uniref:hypothetical protein n=1 Tax=Peterkaempfera podocarpi TaxID=3232308 RepID=UPI00366EFE6C
MPGQRKRKRARERAALASTEFQEGPGHWEVVFSTEDESALRAHVRRLRAENRIAEDALLRADILCGRLVQPTTYQLSVWVADPPGATAAQPAASGG